MAISAVKITRKGQVTIPKKIREKLKGDTVYFEIVDDAVVVRTVRDAAGSLKRICSKGKAGSFD